MLTKPQKAALQRLNATAPADLPRDGRGNIKTGINTNVLFSLQAKGAIEVTQIYLGGIVSADLKVIHKTESNQ